VKDNQKLHKGEVEIEGGIATLADKTYFPEMCFGLRNPSDMKIVTLQVNYYNFLVWRGGTFWRGFIMHRM
jgi:hypothetical protein